MIISEYMSDVADGIIDTYLFNNSIYACILFQKQFKYIYNKKYFKFILPKSRLRLQDQVE